RFNGNDVFPAVAEIVVVPQPVALGGEHLVQPGISLEDALLTLRVDIESGEEMRRRNVVARSKSMQMALEPPHGCLEDVMERVEREVTRKVEPPPHRGLRAAQVQPHPVTTDGAGRLAKR